VSLLKNQLAEMHSGGAGVRLERFGRLLKT